MIQPILYAYSFNGPPEVKDGFFFVEIFEIKKTIFRFCLAGTS
jgi:hypothetical protein